jgi:signal peptidase I
VTSGEDEPRKPFARGMLVLGAAALVMALLLKAFLVQAFFIPSESMERTLHGCRGCRGDRVLVNKVVYRFRDVHRGEVVVFNGKNTGFPAETEVPPPRNNVERLLRSAKGAVGLGGPSEKDFIKRVIGVAGDVVACCTDGKVTVNGQPLDEPYVHLSSSDAMVPFGPVTVPPGRLFVMGDHRDHSGDSRLFDTIPVSSVIGRAFVVFFPPFRQKVLRVPATFDPGARRRALSPPVLGFVLAVPIAGVRRRVRRRRGLVTT